MKKIRIASFAIFLCLLTLAGCGFRVVKTNPASQIKLNKMRLYDPNDCAFEVRYSTDPNSSDPNTINISVSYLNYTIEPNEPVTVPYRFFEYAFGYSPYVNGKLSTGKSVILGIDTGCTMPLLIFDNTVQKHQIPIFAFTNDDDGTLGVCDLPDLTVGRLTFQNQPCFFISQHLEFHLAGIPLWQQNIALMGSPTLQQFNYILFDNPNLKVTFSKAQSFRPDNPDQWDTFPMKINHDPNIVGNRIDLTIPLAGQETEIGFDSGGGNLVLKESAFEKLRPHLEIRSEKKNTFLSIQRGLLNCHKAHVRNFTIGNSTLKNCDIVILPDDTAYLSENEPGYISLREFKDTAVVLDFKQGLMWIKKANEK